MLFKWLASFLISSLSTRVLITLSSHFENFQPISTSLNHAHKKNTPTLGGLAIFLGFMLVRLFNTFLGLNKEMYSIYYASTVCFCVGLYDDLSKIGSQRNSGASRLWKLLVLTFLLLPYFLFVSPDIFTAIKYTSVIIFSCATADIVDGLDGLLSLTALPILISLGTDASISLAGSILGFLYFNLKPAKIFMGDCGAMFIGSLIGCSALSLDTDYGIIPIFTIPIIQIASVGLKMFLVRTGLPHKFFIAPLHHDLERRVGENLAVIILTIVNALVVLLFRYRLLL